MPPADTGNDWAALVLRADADGDEDGLVDFWELTYFDGIDVSAGGSNDQDGDGSSTATNRVPAPIPRIRTRCSGPPLPCPPPRQAILQWPGVAGKTYDVDAGALTSNWTTVAAGLPATASNTYTAGITQARQNYRVRVY